MAHMPVDVHPEVLDALQKQKPVVALESAIITHGMPYPTNLETAQAVEDVVRSEGVVPATTAVIGGRVKVGLTRGEMARLADYDNKNIKKLSARDLSPAVALGHDGGTTCSATTTIASMCGIKVCDLENLLSAGVFTIRE